MVDAQKATGYWSGMNFNHQQDDTGLLAALIAMLLLAFIVMCLLFLF